MSQAPANANAPAASPAPAAPVGIKRWWNSWVSPWRLKRMGILGMNCRNHDFIAAYNPRSLFPLVDNKLKTKLLAEEYEVATPKLFFVVYAQHEIATIENKPGQTGSLAVYAALAAQHGGRITPEAAALGLDWYAEHTADARTHPGKHPNIDRLLAWAQGSVSYSVRLVPAVVG